MEPGKNVFTVHVSGLGSAVTVNASLITIIWACGEETLLESEASEAPHRPQGEWALLRKAKNSKYLLNGTRWSLPLIGWVEVYVNDIN